MPPGPPAHRGVRSHRTLVAALALPLSACSCEESGITRVEPDLEVEPSSLAFGEVPMGATRRLSLTVRNVGNADLELASADAMAPFSARSAAAVVHTGEELVLEVAFSPVNLDPQAGTLSLASNDPDEPRIDVPLTGAGIAGFITVRPSVIDFSATPLGTARSAEIFFSNVGAAEVEGRLVAVAFARPRHFALAGADSFGLGSPLALAPRSEAELVLGYQPLEIGDDGGRLVLEICGDRCGVEVAVGATAVTSSIRLDPPVVDFGTVGIGLTETETVLVLNEGQLPIEVRAIAISGPPELTASTPRPLPATIDPNASMAVNLELRPTSAAQLQGELMVTTDDPGVPVARARVLGRGDGPLFVVQPEVLAFGATREPGTYERSLLLLNAGSADVRVEAVTVGGDGFGLDDLPGLPARVGSGESIVVTATFSPEVLGEYHGEVTIETDDPGRSTVIIPASGALTDQLCELEVAPERVNFGLLPLGFSREKTAQIRNAGTDTCELLGAAFRAPVDPSITVSAGAEPFPRTLSPGDTTEVSFTYAPTSRIESKANYVLTTGDPVFPERHLTLSGSALGYVDVFTRPDRIDFGAVRPGCSAGRRELRLFNAGNLAAEVTSMSITPPLAEVALTAPRAPFTVDAGGTRVFELDYVPADLGSDASSLEIVVRDLPYALIVPIQGEGATSPRTTDTFVQEIDDKVDVLFVIDDSCSMADDQAEVARNFRAFIRQADVRQVDFRIGITTTTIFPTPGALVGPVMTPATANLEATFQRQASVGVGGSGFETGLDAMAGALDLASRGIQPNAALRRADSGLVVVIVSDEDDQSAAVPLVYYNILRQLAPSGFAVAVVSGQRTGCGPQNTPGQGAIAAPRYEEFVGLTQGLSVSLCSDWAMTLEQIGEAAFGPDRVFTLSRAADTAQPIVVTVDGIPAPQGSWTYDSASRTVTFDTAPPAPSIIAVEYTPTC